MNSYLDENFEISSTSLNQPTHENSAGFKELYKLRNKSGLRFADLIDKLAEIAPDVRFRFTSPHPKDFPEKLIDVIKKNENICKQIHLPAQSGSSKVLKNMRRFYTREAYLNLVDFIRTKMPYITLSSDFIAGFCEESEEDFNETLSLLEEVKYDMAFLFAYSMREKTHAYHSLKDNVSEEMKKIRLNKMIDVFKKHQLDKNKNELGKYHIVLVEGYDRKNNNKLVGRTDTNKLCIFENEKVFSAIPDFLIQRVDSNESISENLNKTDLKKGDYAIVRIDDCSNNTLFCSGVAYVKTIKEFFEVSKGKPFIELQSLDIASQKH